MPLKFLIRTSDLSYPIIQGRFHTPDHQTNVPTALLQHRYFAIQVSNDSSNNSEYYGCCDCEHIRIILVREMNFVHYCSDWDLYVASSASTILNIQPSVLVLPLILVPSTLHTNECREFKDWTFIGTCRASVIRLDVEAFVTKHLKRLRADPRPQIPSRQIYPVEFSTFPTTNICDATQITTTSSMFHWHLNVYMDMMIDESYTSVSCTTRLSPTLPLSDSSKLPSIDEECSLTSVCDKENRNNRTECVETKTVIAGGNTIVVGDTSLLLPSKHRKTRRQKETSPTGHIEEWHIVMYLVSWIHMYI